MVYGIFHIYKEYVYSRQTRTDPVIRMWLARVESRDTRFPSQNWRVLAPASRLWYFPRDTVPIDTPFYSAGFPIFRTVNGSRARRFSFQIIFFSFSPLRIISTFHLVPRFSTSYHALQIPRFHRLFHSSISNYPMSRIVSTLRVLIIHSVDYNLQTRTSRWNLYEER